MPITIPGGQTEYGGFGGGGASNDEMSRQDLGYTYHNGLDLRPGSAMSNLIVDEIVARADEASRIRTLDHPRMREMDNIMTGFITLDEKERLRQGKDPRKPVSIVLPVTYAAGDTIHTQILSLLTAQDELHRLTGRGPEDLIGAALLEKMLLMSSQKYGEVQVRSTSVWDFLKYGFAATCSTFHQDWAFRTVEKPLTVIDPYSGQEMPTGDTEKTQIPWLRFEGARTFNIDPYLLLTDPNCAMHEVNDMEYVGYDTLTNRMALLALEQNNPRWVNGRFLGMAMGTGGSFLNKRILSTYPVAGGDSTEGRRKGSLATEAKLSAVGLLCLYATIIPHEWYIEEKGKRQYLGPEEHPVKYMFAISGDRIVHYCAPFDEDHQEYPIFIATPTGDGYGNSPLALLDITKGAQKAIDYSWNSRAKFQQYMAVPRFIGNETFVNVKDVMSGSPFIRLNRVGVNVSIDSILKQVAMQDVTQGNIADIGLLHDFIQRATSATDQVQGVMRTSGERRSATEAKNSQLGALGRIEKLVMLAFHQCWSRQTTVMAHQIRQYSSQQTYARVLGRYEEELLAEYGKQQAAGMPGFAADWQGFYPIDPKALDVDIDVVPMDVTKRGEEFFETWVQLYSMLASNPQLLPLYNMARIFKHIARLGGARNVADFLNPPMMQPGMLPQAQGMAAMPGGQTNQQGQTIGQPGQFAPGVTGNILQDDRVRDMMASGAIEPIGM
jgi:hypothetical protein